MGEAKNILVVEDEALSAMVVKMMLEKWDYQVKKCAATGEEAMAYVEQEQPDLILMDIDLPGDLDGIETALAIKALYKIPIIFMTGYSDEHIIEKAQMVKPLGYFIKPFNLDELRSLIDSALKNNCLAALK